MLTIIAAPGKWRKFLWRFAITGTLMGISLAAGVVITAVMALQLLLPIAVGGLIGVASAGAQATLNALYSGDSEARLIVLTQLKQTFDQQTSTPLDESTAVWILPAIEHCKSDADPSVIALAEELLSDIKLRTESTVP